MFVTPGAHPALLAIFGILAKPGEVILAETLTYPGARSIAAQLGLKLHGLPMDEEGVDPDAFAEACKRLQPKALYLNPTLQNPTTLTISEPRRTAIAAVARRFRVPIVEDDAYGFIPLRGPAPFAAIAPDLTWHVAGLSKCIGAGLRAAYVLAPDVRSGWPFAAAARAANVMASPLTVALATRWIEDGAADAILRFIRTEDSRASGACDGDSAGWQFSRRSDQLQSMGRASPRLGPDPPSPRICVRRASGSCRAMPSPSTGNAPEAVARLLRRPDEPGGYPRRPRIYGACPDGNTRPRLDVSVIAAPFAAQQAVWKQRIVLVGLTDLR